MSYIHIMIELYWIHDWSWIPNPNSIRFFKGIRLAIQSFASMSVAIWNPILPRMSCYKEYLLVTAVRKGVDESYHTNSYHPFLCLFQHAKQVQSSHRWHHRRKCYICRHTSRQYSRTVFITWKCAHAPTTSWGMQHVLGTVDHVEVILWHLKAAIEMHQVNAHRLTLSIESGHTLIGANNKQCLETLLSKNWVHK